MSGGDDLPVMPLPPDDLPGGTLAEHRAAVESLACEVLGSVDGAVRWLACPARALGFESPRERCRPTGESWPKLNTSC